MENRHAAPPSLCAECERSVIDTVESGEHLSYCYCEHNQVLAACKIKNNLVVEWTLEGPLSLAEVARRLQSAGEYVKFRLSQEANGTTQH